MIKINPLRIYPMCNKRLRYNRYNVKLLNDSLPHVRLFDTHLLCRKRLRECEDTKTECKEFFEQRGVIVLDT